MEPTSNRREMRNSSSNEAEPLLNPTPHLDSSGHSVSRCPEANCSSCLTHCLARIKSIARSCFVCCSSTADFQQPERTSSNPDRISLQRASSRERISFENVNSTSFDPAFLSKVDNFAKIFGIQKECYERISNLKLQGFSEYFIQQTFSHSLQVFTDTYELIAKMEKHLAKLQGAEANNLKIVAFKSKNYGLCIIL